MTQPSPRLTKRLQRILVMLPYAITHPGVGVDELATRFGVAREDLLDDLNLLFMCGLPGYGPGDLIDVSVDEGHVYVRMADYFAAPLRLTPVEALSLYAGAAALATMPEMTEADALQRAVAKLGRALGSDGGSTLDVRFERGPDEHLARLRDALERSKRVELEYFSASSGEITTRAVDPWLLYAALGRWYLIAFDHSKKDERMFRTDRIKSVTVLDEAVTVPANVDVSAYRNAFRQKAGMSSATLEISPLAARWFGEYYPVSSIEDMDDGWVRVSLDYSDERWLARLRVSLGADARNVHPPGVEKGAARLAEEILAVYAD